MIEKEKSILVINEGSSDNLGDQAINQSLKFLVQDNLSKNYSFEDFSRNNKNKIEFALSNYGSSDNFFYFKKLIPLKILISRIVWVRNNIGRIIRSCKNNDFAIIGGGQLLLPNKKFPFQIYIWTSFFRIYGLKYSFFSVGTQGNFSNLDKFFLKNALQNASSIYVRDALSRRIILKTFKVKSNLIYDVAFCLDKVLLTKENIKIKNDILVGPIDFNVFKLYKSNSLNRDDYHEIWIDLMKKYDEKNIKLFYSTNDDKFECILFQKYIFSKTGYTLPILENYNLSEFIENIINAKLIISGRMHSLILAKTYKIDFVPYIVSDKVSEFQNIYSDLNLETIQTKLIDKIKIIF